jgi:hypothetical protein
MVHHPVIEFQIMRAGAKQHHERYPYDDSGWMHGIPLWIVHRAMEKKARHGPCRPGVRPVITQLRTGEVPAYFPGGYFIWQATRQRVACAFVRVMTNKP